MSTTRSSTSGWSGRSPASSSPRSSNSLALPSPTRCGTTTGACSSPSRPSPTAFSGPTTPTGMENSAFSSETSSRSRLKGRPSVSSTRACWSSWQLRRSRTSSSPASRPPTSTSPRSSPSSTSTETSRTEMARSRRWRRAWKKSSRTLPAPPPRRRIPPLGRNRRTMRMPRSPLPCKMAPTRWLQSMAPTARWRNRLLQWCEES
mmetsp:Transcript_10703/g.26007  ORF Transcript_10703/g.26007 Transcript_10703/m.26007 type:complete len:204 (+) Transcript_10703:313-924(+)